jgi:hypothetical protein
MPERIEQPEWLDLGYGSPPEVAASLADIDRINRYLGGRRALTLHLYPRLKRLAQRAEAITLIDLGTGSADIPIALAGWARRHQIRLHILAVDIARRHLDVARAQVAALPEVTLVQADAGRLPLLPGRADFVISSLFLHHFSPSLLVRLLSHAGAAAGCVIMSDLVRGRLPLIAFKLVQPIFARSSVTQHDGALSIRRAYTPGELRQLAAQAGLPRVKVHTHWPWRMTLVSDRHAEASA